MRRIGDYSSVLSPPPWDIAVARPSSLGEDDERPGYPEAQAAIYQRTLPSARLFATRQQIMDAVVAGAQQELIQVGVAGGGGLQPLQGSSVFWTCPITQPSHTIMPGDLLFTDTLLDAPYVDLRVDAGRGTCVPVFASFAGHSATLPPGYIMVWDAAARQDTLTGVPVGLLRPRMIVRVMATGDGQPITEPEEEVRIMRAAWRLRNHSLRFVGVAAASHVVGNLAGSVEGISAQVDGTVVLVNTAGRPLLFGDFVEVALPGEHIALPLYPRSLAPLPDPRATIRKHDRPESFARAAVQSLNALFVPPVATAGSYLLNPRPVALAVPGAPAPPGPPVPILAPRIIHPMPEDVRAEVPKEDLAVATLIAFAEAAILWAEAARAQFPPAAGLAGYFRTQAATNGRTVNPLRLAIGAAMGFSPVDVDLGTLADRLGIISLDAEEAIVQQRANNVAGLGPAPVVTAEQDAFMDFRNATGSMLRTISILDAHAGIPFPIGQVMEGGEPNALITVKLI